MGFYRYKAMKTREVFSQVQTEEDARKWLWQARFGRDGFRCPNCHGITYYSHRSRPEIRTCKGCLKQVRVRAGTILEHSKTPLLIWLWILFLMMQGKRGISALEIQRTLGMSSYGTAWRIVQKIREALKERDDRYQLKDLVELDGTMFGRREKATQVTVLVAIESKEWIDAKGKRKTKAGFAKVKVTSESKIRAQEFVDENIVPGTFVNTDANNSYKQLKNVHVDYREMDADPEKLDRWLPWVHKFISNAKSWMIGTHHGVSAKNIGRYLAEYTYRFNRRHDPDSLFHRALRACAIATPKPAYALLR